MAIVESGCAEAGSRRNGVVGSVTGQPGAFGRWLAARSGTGDSREAAASITTTIRLRATDHLVCVDLTSTYTGQPDLVPSRSLAAGLLPKTLARPLHRAARFTCRMSDGYVHGYATDEQSVWSPKPSTG